MKILLYMGGFIAIINCLRMLPVWHYPFFKIYTNNGPIWLYLWHIAETLVFGVFIIFSLILIYNQQWT